MVCDVLKLLVALTGITCRQSGESRALPGVAVTLKSLKTPLLRLTNVNVMARGPTLWCRSWTTRVNAISIAYPCVL